MIHSRFNNNRVTKLHKKYLRQIHRDETSSYEEVMEKDGSVSIHYKNIQTLEVEMFKLKNDTSPAIVSDVFLPYARNHNNLLF